MKIGIYDPYLDDLGGGEKYMMTIAECLSKNHQVSVFWDSPDDLKNLLDRFAIDLKNVKLENNIFGKNTSFIKRFLQTLKYDSLIVLSDGSIPIVWSKLLLHFQQPLTNIKPTFVQRLRLSRVKEVFCNSKFTKSFIDSEFVLDSKVLYPPIFIKAKNIAKENIILSVGRFRVKSVGIGDYKKLGLMIEVFKKMVDGGLESWSLVLAVSVNKSDEGAFDALRREAKGFPIVFEINRTNDELWDFYSKAKIYWHASGFGEDLEKHPEFAEHFGISTVEAMGAGAVPVVINAGGQREIVSDKKNGFLWNSKKELIDQTLKLINNEKLLNTFSKQGARDAMRFGKEDFCKQINELIND